MSYTDEELKPNIKNLYEHRWVWYHTILCIQVILTNIILIAILFKL